MTVSARAAAHSMPDVALPAMGETASGRRWTLADYDRGIEAEIRTALACEPALSRLLAARGISAADARSFLNPSLRDSLPDPSTMTDMDKGAARIAAAIVGGETVGVFGDYDVDGTSAAAILKGYFDALGAALEVYLPDRILEGYGPSIEAFRTLKAHGAKLIITVDCGAAAHEAVNAAAGEGLDIVVLDHHQMDGPPPTGALATINPNRPDDRSRLTMLSAAGVAFMAIVAVNRRLKDLGWFDDRAAPDLLQFLDLAALGLVCDVMPMTGLARVLTAQGLKVLGRGNAGLAALGARAGVSSSPTSYDLGFLLGPRINAAGRIGHARLAFELLTTSNSERRAELAEHLHLMNAERREIEKGVQEAAVAAIERERLNDRPTIVVAGEGWHPGVIGIVAGRIKEIYDRPTVVIGIDGDVGKGSARSLDGVDLGAAIRAARDEGLLIAGGGHAMAAGLTIAPHRVDDFALFLDRRCADDVARALRSRVRRIDSVISPLSVSGAFAELIASAGPYGPGNAEPVFVLASMRVDRTKIVGGDHVACDLVSFDGARVRAIAFRAAGEPLGQMLMSSARLHVAGKVRADEWRGGGAAQFQISDAAEDRS